MASLVPYEGWPLRRYIHAVGRRLYDKKIFQDHKDAVEAILKEIDELHRVSGHPVGALVDASRDADLIIVGSRGLRAFEALGSVSERARQLLGAVEHHIMTASHCDGFPAFCFRPIIKGGEGGTVQTGRQDKRDLCPRVNSPS